MSIINKKLVHLHSCMLQMAYWSKRVEIMTLIKPGGFDFVCTDNKVHHQCDSVDSTVCRMSDSSSSLIKFGRRHRRPSFLVSKRDFLHLIIIIIIIIFLSPRLQRQFTSNLLQTSAQWSLGIHLPD